MSKSLQEHLASAPEVVRESIVGLVKMCGMSEKQRRAAVAPIREHDPQLADDVLAGLPPAGLTGQALVDAQIALVVEQLGEKYGGAKWLRDTGHWPTPDERGGPA